MISATNLISSKKSCRKNGDYFCLMGQIKNAIVRHGIFFNIFSDILLKIT